MTNSKPSSPEAADRPPPRAQKPKPAPPLLTPIYLKTRPDTPWPAREKMFYLLTRDGLFLCRNHRFFRSSVPVEDYPGELARHDPFLKLNFPRVPRRLLEQVVGFFAAIGARHGAEAAALLVWNTQASAVEAIIPEQTSLVFHDAERRTWPVEVRYQMPDLPAHLVLLGDVHSHVEGAAYASPTDQKDERHRPGLHLVVGQIHREPPEFYLDISVDASRFHIRNHEMILEGYARRRLEEVPANWIESVTVRAWPETRPWQITSQTVVS